MRANKRFAFIGALSNKSDIHPRQFPFVGQAVPADNLETGSRAVFVTHLTSPGSLPCVNIQIPVYRSVSLEFVGTINVSSVTWYTPV